MGYPITLTTFMTLCEPTNSWGPGPVSPPPAFLTSLSQLDYFLLAPEIQECIYIKPGLLGSS